MPEVQRHGFDFENWVKETFFKSFTQTSYNHKWDALEVVFNDEFKNFTKEFSNLPVSIKTCKIGGSVGFADALTQFDNKQDFLLIIGFWKQNGDYKDFVAIEAVKILAKEWHQLFDPLTRKQISMLVDKIKDTDIGKEEARKEAQKLKRSFPKSKITLYPKIQEKQRRIQCGLRSKFFWEIIVKKQQYSKKNCELWGIASNSVISGSRIFKPKD